jgi:hypothetical protein
MKFILPLWAMFRRRPPSIRSRLYRPCDSCGQPVPLGVHTSNNGRRHAQMSWVRQKMVGSR